MPGTKLFSRMNYQVTRGFSELLTEHSLTGDEWDAIRSFFDQRCAFCGINPRTGLVPDHLLAAKALGAFCIGNVVPACHDCNDQRGKLDWREYLRRYRTEEADVRISKMEAHLIAHPYSAPVDPYSALTPSQKQEYLAFLEEWSKLWKRAQALRDSIEKRRRQQTRSAVSKM